MQDPLAQIAAEKIPIVYFNGFMIGFGNADFFIRLRLDNTDQMELKCSYTGAKTLAKMLGGMVAKFEAATEHDILTTDDVKTKLEAMKPEAEPPEKQAQ